MRRQPGETASQALKTGSPAETARLLLLCCFSLVSVLVLYLGFSVNYWQVVDQRWFDQFQWDSESLVIGRLVKSGQDGLLSAAGLLGLGSFDATPVTDFGTDAPFLNQSRAYFESRPFAAFMTYHSQIGGQGQLFSVLDRSLSLSPRERLRLFHGLTSMFSAVVLTVIVLWFASEFGFSVGLVVLASAVLSQWLVVFGKSLYWSLWAFYLPVAALLQFFRARRVPGIADRGTLGLIVFVTVFVKCLINGYEFITVTLVMVLVPVVYYGVRDEVGRRNWVKAGVAAAAGSGLAIGLSAVILCLQIASVKGRFRDGVSHLVSSFRNRTHAAFNRGPSPYGASLDASTAFVLRKYWDSTFFRGREDLLSSHSAGGLRPVRVRYSWLIASFAMMSGVLDWQRRRGVAPDEARKARALIVATWFSILAPLSWFLVFKAHSFLHTHTNPVAWQMPFSLFGFSLCGLVLRNLCRETGRVRSRPP